MPSGCINHLCGLRTSWTIPVIIFCRLSRLFHLLSRRRPFLFPDVLRLPGIFHSPFDFNQSSKMASSVCVCGRNHVDVATLRWSQADNQMLSPLGLRSEDCERDEAVIVVVFCCWPPDDGGSGRNQEEKEKDDVQAEMNAPGWLDALASQGK